MYIMCDDEKKNFTEILANQSMLLTILYTTQFHDKKMLIIKYTAFTTAKT